MKPFLVLAVLYISIFASSLVELGRYEKHEFSPILGEYFNIPIKINKKCDIKISIYTPDNNLIRVLQKKMDKKGNYNIKWDGKDTKGVVVPNEAYSIKVDAFNKEKNQTLDFRATGGEIIKNLNTAIDEQGNINYILDKPSRVLIRAGIKSGPMLRTINNWIPKNSGKIRQKWNMKDDDDIIDMRNLDFGISVSAFALPKKSIITQNNKKLEYFDYIKNNNFTCKIKNLKIENEATISQHAKKCRIEEKNPKLKIQINTKIKYKTKKPVLKNSIAVPIRVDMNKEDEMYFSKNKYEVTFFIDYDFSSEEELGYMPTTWLYTPNSLTKGEHTLTVNVSGFSGQIGSKSVKFFIQ